VGARAMNLGLVSGILISIYFWKFQPQVFYFWWNVIGCLTTLGVAALFTLGQATQPAAQRLVDTVVSRMEMQFWNRSTIYLLGFFVLIVAISVSVPYWL